MKWFSCDGGSQKSSIQKLFKNSMFICRKKLKAEEFSSRASGGCHCVGKRWERKYLRIISNIDFTMRATHKAMSGGINVAANVQEIIMHGD